MFCYTIARIAKEKGVNTVGMRWQPGYLLSLSFRGKLFFI